MFPFELAPQNPFSGLTTPLLGVATLRLRLSGRIANGMPKLFMDNYAAN